MVIDLLARACAEHYHYYGRNGKSEKIEALVLELLGPRLVDGKTPSEGFRVMEPRFHAAIKAVHLP